MSEQPLGHSDFIVYVDETGDHSLDNVSVDFPMFGLSFCIFNKQHYTESITPAVRGLKFRTFGHDMVVLHEHDMRKKTGAFALMSKEPREAFMAEMTSIIEKADFTLIGIIIDKQELKARHANPGHPYHIAMEFGLERIYRFLLDHGQGDRLTYIVCEARGKTEDAALELEFRRVRDGENWLRKALPFELIISDKKTNSEGLQLADMTARPIALALLRPGQPNRAMEILDKKFYRDRDGRKEGVGLKCYPYKKRGLSGSPKSPTSIG